MYYMFLNAPLLIAESRCGEDVQQPERDAEGGQRAPERVVRGRAHVSEDGLAFRRHGDHCQGGGQLAALGFEFSPLFINYYTSQLLHL